MALLLVSRVVLLSVVLLMFLLGDFHVFLNKWQWMLALVLGSEAIRAIELESTLGQFHAVS